ncbi:hypothetical protein OSB04_000528 [Centaurea solstitialis]|uniref:Reverse transcriptase zinc-binding domain-containing protein n=1 Tax=Centaurea solstitialis TaxID=347529 RepID=A0AA38WKS7_9ASTR|nr:hypothetical protein OSB04_000528 [Centaurea solstitialis]
MEFYVDFFGEFTRNSNRFSIEFGTSHGFIRLVGRRDNTFFWKDRWISSIPLQDLFLDLYELESNKLCSLASRLQRHTNGRIEELENTLRNTILSEKDDSWSWEGDPSGIFSVKFVRIILDNVINSPYAGLHYLNKWLPPRINCFLLLIRIPIRANLRVRGINIPSDVCPLCASNEETVEHLFLSCPATKNVWDGFHNWCGLKKVHYNSLEQLIFEVADQGKSNKQKHFLEVACGGVLWFLWKARNNVVFNGKGLSGPLVMDEVQASLYAWLKYRSNCNSILWPMWCCNPLASF